MVCRHSIILILEGRMESKQKLTIENIRTNPNRKLLVISIIFLLFWTLSIPTWLGLVPLEFLVVNGTRLPTFQLVQVLVVFPIVLIVTYLYFIKHKLISWQELGFNLGRNGLFQTVSLGLLGGVIQGAIIFFTSNHFLLKNQVWLNFIEKCITAPIWEEFLYRVLLFTMVELSLLLYLKRIENKPNYKWEFRLEYFNIIFLTAIFFSLAHGGLSIYLVSFGVIANLLFIKTRSIIAPSITHFISNFVSGGFQYLILDALF